MRSSGFTSRLSWKRLQGTLSIGSYSSPGAPAPAARPVPGLPGDNVCVCSLLHPLKKWSLRQIRGGSHWCRYWGQVKGLPSRTQESFLTVITLS